MAQTLDVFYDGRVFRPQTQLNLKANTHYSIQLGPEIPAPDQEGDAWDVIASLAGTVEAPEDWSVEHDHYLYGHPKRASASSGE